jgi:hypothetical protein
MTDHLAKLAGISWRHFVRWFVLGRVFRIATQARTLVPASLGVVTTIFGWWVLAQAFSGTNDKALNTLLKTYESCPWTDQGYHSPTIWNWLIPQHDQGLGAIPENAVLAPAKQLSSPIMQLFDVSRTFTGTLFLLLATVWAAAIWAYFGGMITRGALWQLTREEPASIGSVLRHTRKRWFSYFTAPLLPLGGVFLVTLALLLPGLLMRASLLFGGLFWPLALIGGITMAVLMIGLVFGWPLMHATISAEGSDGFDALSRSYSYVFQRPIHYAFYIVAASALGFAGLMLVQFFARLVMKLTAWSVSWGSGHELIQIALSGSDVANTAGLAGHDRWGVALFTFWQGCIMLVVIGYAFGYFWTAISAIYLLLRHDADGAEISELHQEESPEMFGLPPVVNDAAGVPTVPPEVSPSDPGAPPAAS